MLQIAAVVMGLVAVIMGIMAVLKDELQVSNTRKLIGAAARVVGMVTMVFGLAIVVFALLGITWLVSGHPGQAQWSNPAEVPPDRPSEAESAEPKWGRQFTPDGLCSAEFPGMPTKSTIEGNGNTLHRLTFQREAGKGYFVLSYMRSSEDEPPPIPEEVVDKWRDNHLALPAPGGGQFKVIRERRFEKDGVSGRDVDFEAGADRVSLNRLFVIGRATYRLNVVIDPKRLNDADVSRFLYYRAESCSGCMHGLVWRTVGSAERCRALPCAAGRRTEMPMVTGPLDGWRQALECLGKWQPSSSDATQAVC